MTHASHPIMTMVGMPDPCGSFRSALVQRGYQVCAATTHLRGLRRLLVQGQAERCIIGIALEDPMVLAMEEELRLLLQDIRGFPMPVQTIGLVRQRRDRMTLGCDIHVQDAQAMYRTIVRVLPFGDGRRFDILRMSTRHRPTDTTTDTFPSRARLTWNCRIREES